VLSKLPMVWLRKVLERLDNEDQVFILRRSAGFAFSFLSLLRSEVLACATMNKQQTSRGNTQTEHSRSRCSRTSASTGICQLMPVALTRLLDTVENGLADSFAQVNTSIGQAVTDEEHPATAVTASSDSSVLNTREPTCTVTIGSWRMCVHALNVIRLVILDALLAPQLEGFISRVTQLALTGFNSKYVNS
jgi:hypothetical protein